MVCLDSNPGRHPLSYGGTPKKSYLGRWTCHPSTWEALKSNCVGFNGLADFYLTCDFSMVALCRSHIGLMS